MIKYVLPAAVAAIALGAPAVVHAQVVQPVHPVVVDANVTPAAATIVGAPQPGPYETTYTTTTTTTGPVYGAPMPPYGPVMAPSPRTTWIPAHFDWSPATNNYVFVDGQFIEAPRENAQWIPGHWAQTPTAWIWINGGWN